MVTLNEDESSYPGAITLDDLDKAPLLPPTSEDDRPTQRWLPRTPSPQPQSASLSRTTRLALFGLILSWLVTIAVFVGAATLTRVRARSAPPRAWPWPAMADVACTAHSDWSVAPIPKQTIDLSDPGSLPDWIDPAVRLADFDEEGPLDLSALGRVCAKVEWVPGRWLSSEDSEGGIGNTRAIILALVRYAIDGGAGLVMPSLMLRAAEVNGDVENLHRGGRAGLNFMFDVPFFLAQLAEHCPQMPIAADLYHVEGLENAVFPNLFWPPDLNALATGDPPKPRPPPGIRNMDVATFRPDLDRLFGLPAAVNKPQILRLQRPLFQYPIEADAGEFFVRFGRLLRLHPVAEVLASQALAELAKVGDEYMGAHLRLEGDVGENWGGFEEQTSAYLDRLLERKFKIVYVASGDPAPIARFEQLLAEKAPGVKLVTKASLLASRPATLRKLESLHFDQQALVDYLMLLKSTYLVGNASKYPPPVVRRRHLHRANLSALSVAVSSFSVNALVKRHLSLKGQMAEPEVFRLGEDERTFLIRDGISQGMRETMWP